MRRRLAAVIAPLALPIPLTTAHAASSSGLSVSGSFLELGPLTIVSDHPTQAGGEIINSYHPIVFFGGLAGQSTSYEHTVISPKLTFETHNTEYFTGSVTTDSGQPLGAGALTINFNATGDFTSNDGNGQFTAHVEIIGSGGALTGLHGEGTAAGEPGVPGGNGTFQLTLH